MFFELIGTFIAGAAAALLVWAINRQLKGRLPGWLVPVSAGAAMFAAAISSEYGWYNRTSESMPQGMVVALTVDEKVFYRPWTYAKPYITRFVAVDQVTVKTHPDHPDQRIVDLVFYGRWARTSKVPALFDCATGKRADIADGVDFAADGSVVGATWRTANAPILEAACVEV